MKCLKINGNQKLMNKDLSNGPIIMEAQKGTVTKEQHSHKQKE